VVWLSRRAYRGKKDIVKDDTSAHLYSGFVVL